MSNIIRPFRQWQKTDYLTLLWARANNYKTQVRGKYPKQSYWVFATKDEVLFLEDGRLAENDSYNP